ILQRELQGLPIITVDIQSAFDGVVPPVSFFCGEPRESDLTGFDQLPKGIVGIVPTDIDLNTESSFLGNEMNHATNTLHRSISRWSQGKKVGVNRVGCLVGTHPRPSDRRLRTVGTTVMLSTPSFTWSWKRSQGWKR